MVYTIKPRSDVYCFKLNFNISNVGYSFIHKLLYAGKIIVQRFTDIKDCEEDR